MDTKDAVRQAVRAFTTNTDGDDRGVTAALVQDGFSEETAADLVAFVPLAVGRVILGRIGVGIMRDEYSRIDAQGQERFRGKLLDEPIYREALAAFAEVAAQGEAVLKAVLGRSPEFRAANKAFHAGSRPENLYLSRPVLVWREGMPESPIAPEERGRRERAGSLREEVIASFPCPACGRYRGSSEADCPACGWKRARRAAPTGVPGRSAREETSRSWWQFWRRGSHKPSSVADPAERGGCE
jgi:hypothetical protein